MPGDGRTGRISELSRRTTSYCEMLFPKFAVQLVKLLFRFIVYLYKIVRWWVVANPNK